MKVLLLPLSFFFIFSFSTLVAQPGTLSLTGKIVEEQARQPIEFATILALDKETKKALAGTTTDERGLFSLKVKKPSFYLEISFIQQQR